MQITHLVITSMTLQASIQPECRKVNDARGTKPIFGRVNFAEHDAFGNIYYTVLIMISIHLSKKN